MRRLADVLEFQVRLLGSALFNYVPSRPVLQNCPLVGRIAAGRNVERYVVEARVEAGNSSDGLFERI